MKDFITKLIGSLDNKMDGFSGKKLTIFSIVGCVIAAHIKWIMLGDFTQLIAVLTADYAIILTLFGVNVIDKKQNPTS
jgi:hypothetical protein